MAFTEKPPMLRGTTQEQVNALRDYLFRMAQSLEGVATADAAETAAVSVGSDGKRVYRQGTGGGASGADVDAVRKNAAELRSLITKSAKDLQKQIEAGDATVISYADSRIDVYDSRYLAQSTFGSFAETINSTIENTARGVVESYDYDSAIESAQDSIDLLQTYYTSIEGEIRRGLITDPETGETAMGIAISEELRFTGAQVTQDGLTYYELSPGQTLGLYTSKGWQFWINGSKRGWFDSVDGMLHVANLAVENSLRIGAGWLATGVNGFGIRYVGD